MHADARNGSGRANEDFLSPLRIHSSPMVAGSLSPIPRDFNSFRLLLRGGCCRFGDQGNESKGWADGQRGRQRTRVEAGVTHDVSGQQFPGFERVDVNSSGRR
jgi:hypothetical protein